jgi:hypothetical protein
MEAEEGEPSNPMIMEGYAKKSSGGKQVKVGKARKSSVSKGNLMAHGNRRFFRLTATDLRWWATSEDCYGSGLATEPAYAQAKGSIVVKGAALRTRAEEPLQIVLTALIGSDSGASRDLLLNFETEQVAAAWLAAFQAAGAVIPTAAGEAGALEVLKATEEAAQQEAAANKIQQSLRAKKAREGAAPTVVSDERKEFVAKREAVIRLQRAFRKQAFRQALHQVVGTYASMKDDPAVKKIRIRNNVVREMLSTETTYVRGLNQLVDDYLAPLLAKSKTRKKVLSAKDINTIFKGVSDIRALHVNVLSMLKQAWAEFPSVSIAPVFQMVTPFFKVYTVYVNNFDAALATLAANRKKSPALVDLLWQVRSTVGMDLESLMITPVQRIPRYEMMLSELLKYTDPGHVDYLGLMKSQSQVKAVAMAINDDRARFEKAQKLRQLVRQRFSPCKIHCLH